MCWLYRTESWATQVWRNFQVCSHWRTSSLDDLRGEGEAKDQSPGTGSTTNLLWHSWWLVEAPHLTGQPSKRPLVVPDRNQVPDFLHLVSTSQSEIQGTIAVTRRVVFLSFYEPGVFLATIASFASRQTQYEGQVVGLVWIGTLWVCWVLVWWQFGCWGRCEAGWSAGTGWERRSSDNGLLRSLDWTQRMTSRCCYQSSGHLNMRLHTI